jgi:hypothetical protein
MSGPEVRLKGWTRTQIGAILKMVDDGQLADSVLALSSATEVQRWVDEVLYYHQHVHHTLTIQSY